MGQHGKHRLLVSRTPIGGARILAAAALIASLTVNPAQACRLALAFALDVSASVDRNEYQLQIKGVADALTDPAVRAAILTPGISRASGVALAAYEWSGARQQVIIRDWSMITSEEELTAFSTALGAHERRFGEFPTAIGYALGYGQLLMRDAPPCGRQVIDISGDGISNDGFGPDAAYRAFDFSAITVNGLVIGGENLELISFYANQVIRGPGAFIEVASDFEDYRRAMKRKLLREIGRDFVAEAPR